LASVAHRIDAAVRLLAEDPDRSLALLQGASGQVHGALDEARQLVRGLRPHALDELGLIEALRATVPLLAPMHDPVDVRITADEATDGLPAAVEVATFLIAQEALRNIVRHARATEAQITIVVGPPLVLDVTDDGIGYQSPRAGGIGIQTMRERAVELGGSFEIAGGPGGGTQVRAVLPWEDVS
jgi:signal transduction histidine kinase